MVQHAFLRSINVELDIDHPDRFSHFRPTSKSIGLIESVLDSKGDRGLLVVAPYGSGKSLTAGYLLHAVQNEPDRFEGGEMLLSRVADRISNLRPQLGKGLRDRMASGSTGVGVSLYGGGGDTTGMVQEAMRTGFVRAGLGREARSFDRVSSSDAQALSELVDIATEKLKRAGRDHLLIVWDEFGRHLEGMVADGRPGELLALQVLAEAASRSTEVQTTLVLLLHRSFMGYAAGLPTSARQEWSKIEGRFKVVQYVDDSLEMHRLLAGIVRDSRPELPLTDDRWQKLAERSAGAGLFAGFQTEDLGELLADAWPLEPATLWLLPKVAARVAQNERTSFSFLNDLDLTGPVTPSDVYDYFRGEFRADTGPGGTHKAWLEVESALSKVPPNSVKAAVLKTAFLLNLGLGGERARTPRDRLEEAAAGTEHQPGKVSEAVDELLAQKLLIHRSHTDQVMVWHGTDVDLRGRLEDEKRRLDGSFELVPFLSREMPPPVWRPTRHNAERGVPRYLESRFVAPITFAGVADDVTLDVREPGTDGNVLYVLPSSEDERNRAIETAEKLKDLRTFVAVARGHEALLAGAKELAALLRMHQDPDLLGQDPMIRPELDHLTDDARQALRPLMERVVSPGGGGADWFHGGRRIRPRGPVAFRHHLSVVMDDLFEYTPQILSEMVVRRKPTPVVINARKKVALGILERYGQEAFGIEGNFADKAIFRSVLLQTGLYHEDQGRWRLALGEELDDPGLARVWKEIEQFFSEPGAKSVQRLVHRLLEPPYGVREGLIPLFLAAGLKAFPTPKALREGPDYISDVLPSVIEDMARNPADFTVDIFKLSAQQEEYLQALLARFSEYTQSTAPEEDVLRCVFDAMQGWWAQLPQAAKTSSRVSEQAARFRRMVTVQDPARILLVRLAEEFGGPEKDLSRTIAEIEASVSELEDVHRAYVDAAGKALRTALTARGIPAHLELTAAAQRWSGYLPDPRSLDALSPVGKSTLMQLRRAHDSADKLLNALALLVAGKAFKDWDDTVVPEFERRLRAAIEDIEHAALEAGSQEDVSDEVREGLLQLSRARLRLALQQMADLGGQNRAKVLLDEEVEALWSTHPKDN